MIKTIRQGLLEEGFDVSISKRCRWFGVPRRSFYYRPVNGTPKVKPEAPMKALIEQEPPFGYWTVAWLLDMNKNTVQRIFQVRGWQVRSGPSVPDLVSRRCLRGRWPRINADRPTCAGSGADGMAG